MSECPVVCQESDDSYVSLSLTGTTNSVWKEDGQPTETTMLCVCYSDTLQCRCCSVSVSVSVSDTLQCKCYSGNVSVTV